LVNISPRAHIADILSERLELETLLSKLSTRLINLSFEKLEEGIIDVLEEIGRFMKIEKTGIFLFQANQTQMIEAYSWSVAKGKQIMLKSLQKTMNTCDFPSLVNLIIKDQMIVEYNVGIFDKFGLDNNCLDLWSENVNSCMLIPIIIKEQTSGFLYLLSNTREKKWTYNAKLMFKFIGEFLASTLERKRVEEKILLSEKKYKNLIENSPNLILLLDEGGNIIDLNSKSASLFESQINLFLGDSLAIFLKNLSTYYDFKLHDVYKNSNKKHSPTKYLLQLIGEKKEKWYDLVFAPLNMEGETYFQVVGRDITEEKQFESLIKQEITQLKKIDRIRTDFVYRASHELKTPLNAINCASDLLMNYTPEKLDESTLELLNIINKGGNRMKALVNDLVETFRYELQNFNLRMKKIDVMPIIEEIIKEFELQLVERNISLYVSLPKILPLKVDKLRFGLVISNLLSNAFKNTPPAGMILFKAEVKPQEVIFSFKDTGVGITEDEMKSLFKKFGKIERFGTGLDIITEGTGLGLFNTKQIVEKHGGRIWAESEGRNKGSSFFISFPRS
jgi:PAS domain S-box-containing protein